MNKYTPNSCSTAFPQISSKLAPQEHVIALHKVCLLDGWVKSPRILAVVEFRSNYAFFVFNNLQNKENSSVVIEYAFPLNKDFKINFDTKENGDVSLTILSTSHKFDFEAPSGENTNNFVSELYRSIDADGKNLIKDFSWLSKYKKNETGETETPLPVNQKIEKMSELDRQLLINSEFGFTHERNAGPLIARENAVRYQMTLKENDYTYSETIRIFVGTWNVNGKSPSIPLADWLAVDDEAPDIYAVGFQELDLSKETFLFNETPKEEEWLGAVIVSLHPKGKYRKIALVRLVGMMLIVFVKEKLAAYVRGVSTATVGTGIMGKMGNKGGVAVRLDLHSTSICFVNAHLAAHVEEFERRNQDFFDICSRISFPKFLPPKGLREHDQIYWLGDLNYRITELDAAAVKNLLEKNRFANILAYDQLQQNIASKRAFVDFKEGAINFKPTYKYDAGSDEWDTSEKGRAPAWCDRVLWKGDKINQVMYRSHPSLRISDHKPVSALFNSEIRVIDAQKYRKIHEEVMKKLDKLENEFLPQVAVDRTEIIFENIFFLEPCTKSFTISNTGQVPVQFKFINKLDDASYCKDWLHVEPCMGFIKPDEKCEIKVEIYVDKRSAGNLNTGKDKLYDILVLHLEGGKDIFITVTGSYNHSCFGCSFKALSRITVPIREISREELMKMERGEEMNGKEELYQVPKEVWFLVDYLYRNATKQEHLFVQPGLHTELLMVRDWLDTACPDQLPGSIYSVGEALLLLLDSTPEPLIPFSFQEECLNSASNYVQCKRIVAKLPDLNRTVFLYLCSFLQELLSYSDQNNLDANTIATLFGGIFIRDAPPTRRNGQIMGKTRESQKVLDRKKASFMYHFLVNDQSNLFSTSYSA